MRHGADEGIGSGAVDGDALTADLCGGHAHCVAVDGAAGVGVGGGAGLALAQQGIGALARVEMGFCGEGEEGEEEGCEEHFGTGGVVRVVGEGRVCVLTSLEVL
tara:strand:- start:24089 stop:24400 length:312 start_codon:yes stop_codon:yes gene_type:complete